MCVPRQRGHHRITGLGGEIHWTIDGLGPFSPGIWHFVCFDDGLQCWVPEGQFVLDGA